MSRAALVLAGQDRLQYDSVLGYRSYGRMEQEIDRRKRTAMGHAAAMGVDLEPDDFSDAGRRIFLSDR